MFIPFAKKWLPSLVTIFVYCAPVFGQPSPNCYPIIGVVHEGKVWTTSKSKTPWLPLAFIEKSLKRVPHEPDLRHFYIESEQVSPHLALRWRVVHGCLWALGANADAQSCLRIPLKEIDCYDGSALQRGQELLQRRYPKYRPDDLSGLSPHGWPLAPIDTVLLPFKFRHNYAGLQSGLDDWGVYVDFLPIAADRTLLFVLERARMKVWRGRGEFSKANDRWEVKWSSTPIGIYDTDFLEPFVVYGDKDNWTFVTSTGRMFRLTKPDRFEQYIRRVWTKDRQRIELLISDTASGKVFAFGRVVEVGEEQPTKGFYLGGEFEEPRYYDLSTIQPVKAEQPLKAVLEAVQVLVRDKGIVIKESK